MRKTLLAAIMMLPLAAVAQTENQEQPATDNRPVQQVIQTVMQRFGYLSYNDVMKSMPEYETAQSDLAQLRKKYDDEAARSETEFNQKYIEFLEGQKDFPENILRKRQKELQDLMENSIKFRKEAEQLLVKAQAELEEPIRAKLTAALKTLGAEKGYAYILNTDNDTYPFINPNVGEDVTIIVKQRLHCK